MNLYRCNHGTWIKHVPNNLRDGLFGVQLRCNCLYPSPRFGHPGREEDYFHPSYRVEHPMPELVAAFMLGGSQAAEEIWLNGGGEAYEHSMHKLSLRQLVK